MHADIWQHTLHYNQLQKIKMDSCVDKRCFKTIMVVAIDLPKIMTNPVEDMKTVDSAPWCGNCTSPQGTRGRPKRTCTNRTAISTTQYQFEVMNNMSLDVLQPSPSKQKNVLINKVLNMTEQEYNSKHCGATEQVRTLNEDTGVGSNAYGGSYIQADESQRVFAL